MTGLVLKLAPKERILINGAVIENGDRRSRMSILTPNANILRLKDALHPESANTPVRRVCYIAQLVLSGDAGGTEAHQQLVTGVEQLSQVFLDHDSKRILADASEALIEKKYYQVLKALRTLIPREDRLMSVAQQ